jgi:2-polyprenyl-3-methyl-5-hydroxy-6-metoxy-1,4-benzoquinol methylase
LKEKLEDFDKFAKVYETVLNDSIKLSGENGEYFSNYKAEYIARCVGRDFSGRILDYGCGIGLLSEVLLKYFPHAVIDGVDISAASITNVPAPLKKQGRFTPDMNTLKQDYDLIVMANVLHHIEAPQREGVIAKIKDLVKNKGRIIIFEHNPLNPLTRRIVRDSPLDTGVVLLPNSETLLYLKKAGFGNIQLDFIVFFPKFLSSLRWAEPYLSWLPLGAQYASTGQV